MRNLIKICTKSHSKRSHVVAKSKNLLSSWGRKAAIGTFVFGALLVACGDDNSGKNAGGTEEDSGIVAIADKTISGVSQKGPFVNGSSVTVQELDGESLAQTGASYEGKIKNDMGEFSVTVAKLASQYALLKANGFYRNEVTGEKSKSQVTLYALTDLSDRDEVNVNLLTHMEYERSLYLAAEGLSVGKAKKQAESEVLKSFGVEGDFAAAEDLSIFGTDEGAAALLAVSVLMQGDLSEADFSERLANYAADIEQDGKWDDFITATVIADWASNRSLTGRLAAIRNNIAGWGLAADVPAFEKYVDRYWWQVYSLGFCDKDREGEVKAAENALSGNNGVHFICGDGAWRKATDIEKDTYKWESGKDGDVKNGDVVEKNCYVFEDSVWRSGNEKDCSLKLRGCTALRQDTVGKGGDGVWYICDTQNWRKATDIEKDTFGWKDSTDGAIKKGNVTDAMYVFDKSAWRAADSIESKNGVCVSAIADSVVKFESIYFVCKDDQWTEATIVEYDTYHYAGVEGDSKWGRVNNDACYVFEEGKWRGGNTSDCALGLRGCTKSRENQAGMGNDGMGYRCELAAGAQGGFNAEWRRGLYDQRDEHFYKITTINGREWMAQNLNYSYPGQSFCYDNKEENCETYGKLYTVNALFDAICPEGYHIPDDSDWRNLIGSRGEYYGDKGKCLKSKREWPADSAGSDCLGFDALPSGFWGQHFSEDYDFYELRHYAEFWSSSTLVIYLTIRDEVGFGGTGVQNARAVRCINDIATEPPPKVLGTCTQAIEDSVGLFGGTYYICKSNSWVNATEIEYDTYRHECSLFGQIIHGNVKTDYIYFCDGEKWMRFYGNENLSYGKIEDVRDGQVYPTIEIDNQVWMAKNLNFDTTGAVCYENRETNCEKYGRLYSADLAKKICPAGWHLPDETEFRQLLENVENSFENLKSIEWGGDDLYGFAALPAGWSDAGLFSTSFFSTGWWLNSSETCEMCPLLGNRTSDWLFTSFDYKSGFSVRCVKDEE